MKAIDYEVESDKRNNWLDITGGAAKDSLTVLDYFAAKALPVVKQTIKENLDKDGCFADTGWSWDDDDFTCMAEMAYQIAEEMLKVRTALFTPQGTIKGVTGKTYG